MARPTEISKFMSLVLRHAPEQAGLTLDDAGWTDFGALCSVLSDRYGATEADVRNIVEDSPKKRFVLDGSRIRAAQGHSVEVELGLRTATPPDFLFHGTKRDWLPAILAEGLTKQSRHHVHLSADLETATVVGARRKGESVVLRVEAGRMAVAGIPFFLSENDVWLTETVAPEFLTNIEQD